MSGWLASQFEACEVGLVFCLWTAAVEMREIIRQLMGCVHTWTYMRYSASVWFWPWFCFHLWLAALYKEKFTVSARLRSLGFWLGCLHADLALRALSDMKPDSRERVDMPIVELSRTNLSSSSTLQLMGEFAQRYLHACIPARRRL